MAFVIFNKSNDVYAIADNENYLNNFNIMKHDYNIFSISNENFNFIRLSQKSIAFVNGAIVYENIINNFSKETLALYIKGFLYKIDNFLKNNPNHLFFQLWVDYNTLLKNLNLNNIQYPLNKSLEEYLEQNGSIALNPLQVP
jgi:hypothetical protein